MHIRTCAYVLLMSSCIGIDSTEHRSLTITYVHMYVWMYYMYVCMYIYIYIYAYTYVCLYVIDEFMYRNLQHRTSESHNNICAYVCMYVLYVCVYVYIYIYIYMVLGCVYPPVGIYTRCVFIGHTYEVYLHM